jgi:hypothetical protein
MNADDVRNLMPKSVEEIVEEITQKCAEEAKKGHFIYKTWGYGFGESIDTDKKQKEIIEGLEALGFKACHPSNFGQFADAWLEVSWEKEEDE